VSPYWAVLAVLIWSCFLAQAQERWDECAVNDDCVITPHACGSPAFINKKHLDVFKRKERGTAKCEKTLKFEMTDWTKRCEWGLCRGYARASDKAKRICKVDTDCTFVRVGCWQWVAIGKKFVNDNLSSSDYLKGAKDQCLSSLPEGPQPTGFCREHGCQ
jgi:hypothetical protein